MNLLIVADKSDIRTYESVMKAVPNTSVLGAVTRITPDFIKTLREKYNPHAVVIDTEVSTKDVDIKSVIETISKEYPYMKIVVLTDENDYNEYPAYCVIQGQISNLEMKELLKNMSTDTEYSTSTIRQAQKSDIDGSAPTEKLSDKQPNRRFDGKVDNLFTSIPKSVKIRRQLSRNFRFNPLIIAAAVAAVLLVLIIILIARLGNKDNNKATSDEAVSGTVVTEVIETTEQSATEEETTIEEQWDYPLLPTITADTDDIRDETTAPTESTAQSVTIKADGSSDKHSTASGGSVNNDNSSDPDSQSFSYNEGGSDSDNQSNNTNANNNMSNNNGGSASVSYGGNTYHNSQSNEVSGIKLSYSSKTLQIGDTLQLTATISPSTANQSVSWSSSNAAVVSVNNGFLTAKSSGAATITARADNGKTASCAITVNEKQKIDNVHLSAIEYNLEIGQTVTITLFGTDTCEWNLGNSAPIRIVTRGNNNITIKAVEAGKTQLIAKDTKTDKRYVCRITVY